MKSKKDRIDSKPCWDKMKMMMTARMRCIFCTLASALFGFLALGILHAQEVAPLTADPMPSQAAPAAGPKKKIVYREKSYFEFEDTLINGNLRAPDGSFIFRKNQSSFSSALNLKRSFIPEMKASSQDAR